MDKTKPFFFICEGYIEYLEGYINTKITHPFSKEQKSKRPLLKSILDFITTIEESNVYIIQKKKVRSTNPFILSDVSTTGKVLKKFDGYKTSNTIIDESLITEFIDNPSLFFSTIPSPFSIFIIDKGKYVCEQMSKKYGYIFLEKEMTGITKKYLTKFQLKVTDFIQDSKEYIFIDQNLPCNSMLLCDTYLFKIKEERKSKTLKERKLLKQILLYILPENLDSTFHLALLMEGPKIYAKNRDEDKKAILENIAKVVKSIVLKKEYKIELYVLMSRANLEDNHTILLTDDNGNKFNFPNPFHDRKLITNSRMVKSTNSLANEGTELTLSSIGSTSLSNNIHKSTLRYFKASLLKSTESYFFDSNYNFIPYTGEINNRLLSYHATKID